MKPVTQIHPDSGAEYTPVIRVNGKIYPALLTETVQARRVKRYRDSTTTRVVLKVRPA